MALDPKLLEILACPEDKGPLLYFRDEQSLYNPRLKRRYAIRDDIPIMQNRLTWALRVSGHVLRIAHEHTSAPIGFEDQKAILQRTSTA